MKPTVVLIFAKNRSNLLSDPQTLGGIKAEENKNAHEMNAHEPIRQEDAHAQAKKKQKVTVFTAHVIVADAREPGEPQLFYFSLQDAPRHMQKQLKQNNNTTYEFLSNDGTESLMGLVNENSEEADARAEEVWNYIDSISRHQIQILSQYLFCLTLLI